MPWSDTSPCGPDHWWFAEAMPEGRDTRVVHYDVMLESGEVVEVHYAFGGGEDQPPFEGWFRDAGGWFYEVSRHTFLYYRRSE